MIKIIVIEIGLATASNLCHPVSLSNSDREITLPNSQPLLEKLNKWQEIYNQITRSNPNRKVKPSDNTAPTSEAEIAKLVAKCKEYGAEVLKDFNTWLQPTTLSEELCKYQIDSSDQFQILLQIKDKNLERLPWHLANIFKDFSTEVALFKPSESSDKSRKYTGNNKIKILAVFGSNKDIKSEEDLEKLEKIASWDLVTLKNQPEEKLSKEKLFDKLDEERWDILFFAGHSSSSGQERIGKIYLHDECDGLTFEEISNVINRSVKVKKGLKIAFFNSCDGLGLGHSLSRLGVPQIILMKEQVTDDIAQKFLEDFLEKYSQGTSFYQSVRHARENLQGNDFPCADWLPTIYQSSKDYPPSWADLHKATTIEGADIQDESPKSPKLSVENPPNKYKQLNPITLGLAACIFVVTSTIILNRKQLYSALTHEEKWQPYENAEIKFDHPSQWGLDPKMFTSELENDIPGATLKLYSSAETNKSCPEQLTLNIKTTPTSGYTLDLYRQDKIRRIRNPDTNNEVQLTELTTPDTKLANRQAYRLNFQINDRQCKTVKSLETGMIDRDKIYVLNYRFIPDGREEAHQQIFDRIVTSFKIK